MTKSKEELKEQEVIETLAEYEEFRANLTALDTMNFETLISLPNALELISQLGDGQYKRMAVFALAVNKLIDEGFTNGGD